jgi:hypothetical protein
MARLLKFLGFLTLYIFMKITAGGVAPIFWEIPKVPGSSDPDTNHLPRHVAINHPDYRLP